MSALTLPAVVVLGLALILLERARPAAPLPHVPGWWTRAIGLNLAHVAVVILAGLAWQRWVPATSLLALREHVGPLGQGLVAYLAATFVYYWWHRARHESRALWLLFHQVHHSPRRLEVVTAFYKHPLEAAANAALSAALVYPLLGCSPAGAAIYTLLAASAELFYHLDVRTPRWLGYLVQRPEAHRVHHRRGHHSKNYGDLPLWDMLFGTFDNPRALETDCGFDPPREARLGAMLACRDVHAPEPSAGGVREARLRRQNAAAIAVLALGLLQLVGTLAGVPALRGLGAASGASPLPKVFTAHRGVETFAAEFWVHYELDGEPRSQRIGPEEYQRLRGPYNRRNVYGAALAFGPLLPASLRDPVLRFGVGPHGPFRGELGLPARAERVRIEVRTLTRGGERTWTLDVPPA